MSSWPWWLAAGAWLLVVAVCLYARHRARQPRTLSYDYTAQRPAGTAAVLRQFGRSFEALTWGSSVDTWTRRCEASLAASRRRRGVER